MFYLLVNKYNLIEGCPQDALDEPNTQIAHHKNVVCPFCKRLHAQVPKMNELGITVKYLASPIASVFSVS
jgi:hypothetical protein